MVTDVPRIDVHEARRKVQAGEALLVCAYEDPAKCRQLPLEGAMPLSELEGRAGSIAKDREIVFYCA